MDKILQEIHKSADIRVKNWFLLDYHSPISLSIILGIYLSLAFVILPVIRRQWVDHIPNLYHLMSLHNGLLVITNFALAALYIWNMKRAEYNLWGEPVRSSLYHLFRIYDNNIAVLQWWCFILKIFELIDVIFITWRRVPLKSREFNALTYHHASMLIIGWIGAKYLPGGSTAIMSALNCATHVLLYFYCLLRSTLGIGVLQYFPFSSVLSFVTIVQFLLVILHCITGIFSACGYPPSAYYIVILLVTSYMEAFYGCSHKYFSLIQNHRPKKSSSRTVDQAGDHGPSPKNGSSNSPSSSGGTSDAKNIKINSDNNENDKKDKKD